MSNEKKISGVIVPRHDTAINWSKATNFIPKDGELIVFTKDADGSSYDTTITINGTVCAIQSSDKVRFKFGDGKTNVNLLPFVETGSSVGGVTYDEMVAYFEQAQLSENFNTLIVTERKKVIGPVLHLDDIHPVQSNAILKVLPSNVFDIDNVSIDGWSIDVFSNEYSQTGLVEPVSPTTDMISIPFSFPAHGKYTLTNNSSMDFVMVSDSTDATIRVIHLPVGQAVLIDTAIEGKLDVKFNSLMPVDTSSSWTLEISVIPQGCVTTSSSAPSSVNICGEDLVKTLNVENTLVAGTSFIIVCPNDVGPFTVPTSYNIPLYAQFTPDTAISNIVLFSSQIGTMVEIDTTVPLLPDNTYTLVMQTDSFYNTTISILYGKVNEKDIIHDKYLHTVNINADNTVDTSKIQYPCATIGLDNIGYTLYMEYDTVLYPETVRHMMNALPVSEDIVTLDMLSDYAKTTDLSNYQNAFANTTETSTTRTLNMLANTTYLGKGTTNKLTFTSSGITANGVFKTARTPVNTLDVTNKEYVDNQVRATKDYVDSQVSDKLQKYQLDALPSLITHSDYNTLFVINNEGTYDKYIVVEKLVSTSIGSINNTTLRENSSGNAITTSATFDDVISSWATPGPLLLPTVGIDGGWSSEQISLIDDLIGPYYGGESGYRIRFDYIYNGEGASTIDNIVITQSLPTLEPLSVSKEYVDSRIVVSASEPQNPSEGMVWIEPIV